MNSSGAAAAAACCAACLPNMSVSVACRTRLGSCGCTTGTEGGAYALFWIACVARARRMAIAEGFRPGKEICTAKAHSVNMPQG